MEISEKHYSVKIADDVAAICAPLFKSTQISTFLYARIFDNKTTYALISDRIWHRHHFKHEYLATPPIPEKLLTQKFYYLVTPDQSGPFQPTMYDFRNLLNIDYPLLFIERYCGYYDLFFYATTPNNDYIINFYLNNMDVLERFKFYFKEKAASLIEKSKQHKIVLPKKMWPTFKGLDSSVYDENKRDTSIFCENALAIKHYVLNNGMEDIMLTRREIESIKYLIFHRTLKETAKVMNISPRTLETYLHNAIYKLNCKNISEVINIFLKNNFFRYCV